MEIRNDIEGFDPMWRVRETTLLRSTSTPATAADIAQVGTSFGVSINGVPSLSKLGRSSERSLQ